MNFSLTFLKKSKAKQMRKRSFSGKTLSIPYSEQKNSIQKDMMSGALESTFTTELYSSSQIRIRLNSAL